MLNFFKNIDTQKKKNKQYQDTINKWNLYMEYPEVVLETARSEDILVL